MLGLCNKAYRICHFDFLYQEPEMVVSIKPDCTQHFISYTQVFRIIHAEID